jgi:hypothetical protein
MRKLVSTGLTLVLSAGAAGAIGMTPANASTAPATPSSSQASAPQLDLVGIENQLQFIINEVLNITSNNLVICLLSGLTSPNCGHNPV